MLLRTLLLCACVVTAAGCQSAATKVLYLSSASTATTDEFRTALCDPVDCRGMAGRFGGMGAKLQMTYVSNGEYGHLPAVVTEREAVQKNRVVSGRLVFVSDDALRKADEFVPPLLSP